MFDSKWDDNSVWDKYCCNDVDCLELQCDFLPQRKHNEKQGVYQKFDKVKISVFHVGNSHNTFLVTQKDWFWLIAFLRECCVTCAANTKFWCFVLHKNNGKVECIFTCLSRTKLNEWHMSFDVVLLAEYWLLI